MVQLKEEIGFDVFDCYDISIPYGAIKSRRHRRQGDNHRCISIPYGAIKRSKMPIDSKCWIFISIPYGAIKRMERGILLISCN